MDMFGKLAAAVKSPVSLSSLVKQSYEIEGKRREDKDLGE
tara:strand:- start:70 stop:189 length:120 start_codon:yes stop_codon:yes gene_type:complete